MEKIISGKVREVYDVQNGTLIIVATDRISAFDVILPTLIKGKGQVLTAMSKYWFSNTQNIIKNHLISTDLSDFPKEFQNKSYEGRTMLVKKLKMLPYEIIVRGYMFGSMFKAYEKDKSFLGYTFNHEYKLAEKLAKPIVTPSTKAKSGHDENISLSAMKNDIGQKLTDTIETAALTVYSQCATHAEKQGIIIADTKFEFGLDEEGNCVLADEVLTPDSSRFWDKASYKVGESPFSYDKQFIRDWLLQNDLAGSTSIKEIPQDIIEKTSQKYQECKEKLCTKEF